MNLSKKIFVFSLLSSIFMGGAHAKIDIRHFIELDKKPDEPNVILKMEATDKDVLSFWPAPSVVEQSPIPIDLTITLENISKPLKFRFITKQKSTAPGASEIVRMQYVKVMPLTPAPQSNENINVNLNVVAPRAPASQSQSDQKTSGAEKDAAPQSLHDSIADPSLFTNFIASRGSSFAYATQPDAEDPDFIPVDLNLNIEDVYAPLQFKITAIQIDTPNLSPREIEKWETTHTWKFTLLPAAAPPLSQPEKTRITLDGYVEHIFRDKSVS